MWNFVLLGKKADGRRRSGSVMLRSLSTKYGVMLPSYVRPSLSGIEYNPATISVVKIRWNAPL